MSENKETSAKKDASAKKDKDKKSFAAAFTGKFKDIVGEFKKIIWPDRKDLVKSTVNVIATSLIIGVVIVIMDFLFSEGYSLFLKLFQ